MSARSNGLAVLAVLTPHVGYWQNRRRMEANSGLTRCQFANGVKYARDVLCEEQGLPPLITRLGEVALARSASQYRRSRVWEFSYNRSRVGTCHDAARSAVRQFPGQTGSPQLEADAMLLKMATAFLRAVHEPLQPNHMQMVRATTRILSLRPDQRLPDTEQLFQ